MTHHSLVKTLSRLALVGASFVCAWQATWADGFTFTNSFELPGVKSVGKNSDYASNIVKPFINWGLKMIAGVAILMLIWTGIGYLTSMGSDEKVKKAKRSFIWVVIGIVSALSAGWIINIVNNISLK